MSVQKEYARKFTKNWVPQSWTSLFTFTFCILYGFFGSANVFHRLDLGSNARVCSFLTVTPFEEVIDPHRFFWTKVLHMNPRFVLFLAVNSHWPIIRIQVGRIRAGTVVVHGVMELTCEEKASGAWRGQPLAQIESKVGGEIDPGAECQTFVCMF